MIDFGTVRPGTLLYIPFHTFDSNDPSASVTLTGLATTDIEIYKDGGTTQRASDNGYALIDTDGIDVDGITGIHEFSVDLADNSTAGFYASGSQYKIVVASVTVDGATINFIAATFRIGYPDASLNTTIATLSSQTSFTLTVGPAEDDALNGCVCVIHDVASAVQLGFAVVADYTGSTKTVTLTAGVTFTAAATDNISFYPPVNARWFAALATVALPATPTNITAGTITTVTNLTNAPTAGDFTATMKTSAQTAAAAALDAENGANFTAIPWNAAWDAEVQSEVDDAINAQDLPTNTELNARTLASASYATASALDAVDNFIDTEIADIRRAIGPATTTIATLASQTSFTLTAGSADDDAYNGWGCLVVDASSAVQTCLGVIEDYTGSTKTVTLREDPGVFTMATTDLVILLPGKLTDPIAIDVADFFTVDSGETSGSAVAGSVVFEIGELAGAGGAPSAATVAAAVWDLDATGHQTQGTFGQAIGDPVADTNTIFKAVVTDATGATVGIDVTAALADTNELQTDWANGGRLDNILDARSSQTSVDDLPTNAELATALGTADDAVLSAIAALNNLSQANVRTAVGLGSANLDTQLGDLPTNAELATALGTADDATLSAIAAVDAKIDTIDNLIDTEVASLLSGIIFGTAATGTLSTTQATSSLSGYANDQLIGRVLIVLAGDAEGEATRITDYAATGGLLTFDALTAAMANGDAFKIV